MSSRSPSDPDAESEQSVDSAIAEEVTRIESIRYLEGASGHATVSLLFLLGGVVLVSLGAWGVSVVMVIVAYGVAAHGLSIYVWDELRASLTAAIDTRDTGRSTRTLTPHSVSTEMKSEVLAGFAMTVGVAASLGLALLALRTVGPRITAYLAVGVLAVGNVVGLVRTYRTANR